MVDLRDAVRDMVPLLEKSLHGSYAITLETDPEPCPALVDVADLELALLNLLTNARAMPAVGPIGISVARQDHGPDAVGVIVLGVHDRGDGMPAEVQKRAFEPFFTTKSIGKGTGLGLSSVYGFARQSGGTARIISSPTHGTSVLLVLPVSTQPPVRRTSGGESRAAAPLDRVATGTSGRRVLMVEDDVLVRMVTIDAIEEAGYQVVAAEDGVEALAVLERQGVTLDAVVTDIAMPGGVSGIDIVRVIKRDWPQLRVILTTGYTADTVPVDDVPDHFAFVPKPFATQDLVRRLSALLDGAAARDDLPA